MTLRSGVEEVTAALRRELQERLVKAGVHVEDISVPWHLDGPHVWSGIILLAFIVYHLAHFTFGVIARADVNGQSVNYLDLRDAHDPKEQDVYRMVVVGFGNPWITLSYLVAQVFLCLHLWHGVSSFLQSLGLNNRRWSTVISALGPIIAILVVAGNCAIVLSVWLGVVH